MPGDRSHTLAALILCGLSVLVMVHYDIELLHIIYAVAIFMFVTVYGDISTWHPYIDKVPPRIQNLFGNIIISPVLLCICFTVVSSIVIGFLMIFWVPLVEPVISSTKEIMEQMATGKLNAENSVWIGWLYVVVASAQVFRVLRFKLLSRGLRR